MQRKAFPSLGIKAFFGPADIAIGVGAERYMMCAV